MTICVIHGLEVVEVEIEQARRRAVTFGERNESRNLPHESAPVEDRQQRVLVGRAGHVFQPRAGLFHLAPKQLDLVNQPAGGFANAGVNSSSGMPRREAEAVGAVWLDGAATRPAPAPREPAARPVRRGRSDFSTFTSPAKPVIATHSRW